MKKGKDLYTNIGICILNIIGTLKMPKNASMGMGALIVFIAMILTVAISSAVLISTSGTLNSRARMTSSSSTQDVGTSMLVVEAMASDGRDSFLEYWHIRVKMCAGSDPLRFRETLIFMSLSNTTGS